MFFQRIRRIFIERYREGIDLDSIFSIKTKRVLRNDWTIAHNKQLYQIKETPPDTRIKSVVVEERIDNFKPLLPITK